jgi:hypothetical protein
LINSLQLIKQFDEQISSSELTAAQRKILLSKYVDLLLSQLEVGDSIEGLIAKVSDDKYVLQVKPHVNIPIHMLEQLEAGKLMTFVVQGKESGKLYLQPSYTAEAKKMSLIQKTLTELNLPKTPAMQQVVENFLQKQLPLGKEMLLKTYQMSKEYDVSSKVITNLIDSKQVISSKELSALAALRTHGMQDMIENLKTIVQGLTHTEDRIEIFNMLKENIPRDKLDILTSDVSLEEINHKLPSQVEQISSEPQTKLASIKNSPLQLFEQEVSLNELIRLDDGTIFKKVAGKLYDEVIMLRLENMKSDVNESEKIYNTYNLLAKIIKTLDKSDLSGEEKEYINSIKEPLALLGKFNLQAEYFMFPMFSENKQMQGEMYFFKPKKVKKADKSNLYIVLALSLPNLNNIEIHINKQGKDILFHINIENEEIQKQISQYVPKLNEEVQGLGFTVKSMTWGIIGQNTKEISIRENIFENQLNHMDLKI